MQDFHNLQVWRKSHELVLAIYSASAGFPDAERYGLTSQMRRAAMSIPANIAEGCGRESKPDLRRFLYIAMGSASELDYHLLLARDLEMLASTDHRQLQTELAEVKRMLTGLIQRLSTEF